MKRLVVCCDGTWQQLSSPYPTNVAKIAQAVKPMDEKGIHQIVFFHEGIGTGDKLDRITGGAFGWGIDKNIQDAYRFLCLNYIEGDEIYLFGFSRGAYTARSLAGLIYCSGLLTRWNIRKAPEAYDLYRDRDIKPSHPLALAFRQKYAQEVPVTLLGCWDTVGELGIPDQIPFLPLDNWVNKKYQFHDTVLNKRIQNAFHAVAIDEQRKVFDVTPMRQSEKNPNQNLLQVWFPGTHGCIGGGTEETRGLSDSALLWMMNQIKDHHLGLNLNPETVEYGIHPDYAIAFDNRLHGIYASTGRLLRKVVGASEHDSPQFHESVHQRWQNYKPPYRPENLRELVDLGVSLATHV
jgi:uncharacterized protein (DUF2235 family)